MDVQNLIYNLAISKSSTGSPGSTGSLGSTGSPGTTRTTGSTGSPGSTGSMMFDLKFKKLIIRIMFNWILYGFYLIKCILNLFI